MYTYIQVHMYMKPADVWLCVAACAGHPLNRSMYVCTSTAHDYILCMLQLRSCEVVGGL